MAVRISKKDKELIRKVNQNVRAKKNRLKNEFKIESSIQPLKIKDIKSRKQINAYLQEAREFTKGYANKYRKNKYGFVMRVADINKIKHDVERANIVRKRRLRELKDEEFKSRGESTGIKALDRMMMGDSRYASYQPIKFDFNTIKSQKQLEKRVQHIKESSTDRYFDKRNEVLKDNILKSIATNWGNLGIEAFKFINSLTPDQVAREFETEDVFHFEIFGSPQGLGDINKNIERFYKTYKLGQYA